MHNDLVVKTKSLGGTSELTVLAPLRPGLVASLESVTYKTRVRRLLGALNLARTLSHEYSYFRPFSDAVERVGKIHAVRITVVEPDKLMLSVIFDGGRESYMRTLWQKVGTLLDVIFCNTVGYVTAWDHRFDEWADWVRSMQIETDYLYATPALSVDDLRYLRVDEALRREPSAGALADELASVRHASRSVEDETWTTIKRAARTPKAIPEIGRQGLRATVLLHRLNSLYLPIDAAGAPLADGAILHRASRDLLQEFVRMIDENMMEPVLDAGRKRFAEQIAWLKADPGRRPDLPTLPTATPQPDRLADVQGGIIASYTGITHGCLLLIAFRDAASAATFLGSVLDGRKLTTAQGSPDPMRAPTLNIAFTCAGLRALGLPEEQLELFPQEFREGMEARASVLGDVRGNHPQRWRLPARNWGAAAGGAASVELSSVHAIVQMRMGGPVVSKGSTLEPGDSLFDHVQALLTGHESGVQVLSVQPLARYFTAADASVVQEHFGYADGESQPVLDPAQNGSVYDRNQVQLGEFLVGYANQAEKPLDPGSPTYTDADRQRSAWLKNGSFLVVRKLGQDVGALQGAVDQAVDAIERSDGRFADDAARAQARETVYAKMMGRWRNGMALAAAAKGNDFDYAYDPQALQCPFHAHIRRANPRAAVSPATPPGLRTPRLIRRSMSYGAPFSEAPSQSRGMVFMAYNASIAEQFEVVQRWLSGGNSSGGYSGQSDPFLGVPTAGGDRSFRYEDDGKVRRVALDGSPDVLTDPQPFVRLEWGAYLFAPSIGAIGRLAGAARAAAAATARAQPPWRVADGWAGILALQAIEREHGEPRAAEAWKAALEDPEAQRRFDSASVWAAIRARCGGVLRTPYGVIVADRSRVMQVLADRSGLYSVSGYRDRMAISIGEIYLGLDDTGPGCPYRAHADKVNAAATALDPAPAFEHARGAARTAIDLLVADETRSAEQTGAARWELNLDIKEVVDSVLAALCQRWFGLRADDPAILPGGARFDWAPGQPPRYPGHFTAPSRYIFQPRPGRAVQEFATAHGQALQTAFGDLIRRHRDGLSANPPQPALDEAAPLAQAILGAFPSRAQDDLAARTMIGVMMGFLPTVDGNLRLSLNEWLRDGSFWALRTALLAAGAGGPVGADVAIAMVEPRLIDSMMLRPSPELVWRTATRHHQIGDEAIEPGDKVIVAIVSATQQGLESAERDVSAIFGGHRTGARHPPHACPAQGAAMAVMAGIAVALLERVESMRPGAAPLTLALDGAASAPAAQLRDDGFTASDLAAPMCVEARVGTRALRLLRRTEAGVGDTPRDPAAPRVGAGHTLLVDGDSWFCYSRHVLFGVEQNLACHLRDDHGFDVPDTGLPNLGSWLLEFYDRQVDFEHRRCDKPDATGARLDALCNTVKDMVRHGRAPSAILLSAAGNDVVDKRLRPLLNLKGDPAGPLNEPEVARVVDGLMQCWLVKILTRITRECVTLGGTPIPVFLHGYDHPVPDGRNAFGSLGNSPLLPSFEDAGYRDRQGDLQARTDIMKRLIQRLNTMQKGVVGQAAFAGRVFHVDLTGTLSNAAGAYLQDWDNELHPSQSGFARLADKFAAVLAVELPALQPAAQVVGLRQMPAHGHGLELPTGEVQ